MSNLSALLRLFAISAIMSPGTTPSATTQRKTHRTRTFEEQIQHEREDAQIKGLKRFVIDGKIVYAINEKNAKRKAEKMQVI